MCINKLQASSFLSLAAVFAARKMRKRNYYQICVDNF